MKSPKSLLAATLHLSDTYPMIASGLLANTTASDDRTWDWAELAYTHVLGILEHTGRSLDDALEAFAITSIDFMRLQARFKTTGRYARSEGAALQADLYSDPEEMLPYLDGLALTYSMWPNHARLLGYFVSEFIDRIPAGADVLEVGPGHGLFATTLLRRRPDVTYVGVDISPSSIDYSTRAFEAAGLDSERFSLVVGDATAEPSPLPLEEPAQALICSEVLEHVERPTDLLRGFGQAIQPGSQAFLTTVANLEAVDHIYLFRTAAEIRDCMESGGFSISSDLALPVKGAETDEYVPLNYAAIAQSAAT
jgi:2-polyprenyl-3-methyl-5-hydroxy-6-metoxy-1,4-benzoquinol methylase